MDLQVETQKLLIGLYEVNPLGSLRRLLDRPHFFREDPCDCPTLAMN